MYGMLIGVAVFSTAVSHWAKQDMLKMEEQRIKTEKSHAQDIRNALESAILVENVNDVSYSEVYDLGRAQGFLSRSTGRTRTGADVQLTGQDSTTEFGRQNRRIAITASDDTFLRDEVSALGDADALSSYSAQKDQSLEVFDTSKVRTRQIKQSEQILNMEASQLYRYAMENNYTFPPDQATYEASINNITNFKDVWGADFTYVPSSANPTSATIYFVTPWGVSRSIIVTME